LICYKNYFKLNFVNVLCAPTVDSNRPPLYQPPAKKEEEEVKMSGKKRKSISDGQRAARTPIGSGKVRQRRVKY
jgi:hypothetical protein